MNSQNMSIPFSLVYLLFSTCILKLKNLESWRGLKPVRAGFAKEEKEALNAQIVLFLKPIFESEYGMEVNIDDLACYVLARLLRKHSLWDGKPRNVAEIKDGLEEDFDAKVASYVSREAKKLMLKYRERESYKAVSCGEAVTDEQIDCFAEWLHDKLLHCNPNVVRVYQVAKTIGTVLEYEEVKDQLRYDVRSETRKAVYKALKVELKRYPKLAQLVKGKGKYASLKRVLDKMLHFYKVDIEQIRAGMKPSVSNTLLISMSWSRFTHRWQNYHAPVYASILTHMLETALLGYLLAWENGQNATTFEEYEMWKQMRQKAFCVGLYHDIAEVWTDDIPSPAKDMLGIRKKTEQQEKDALLKYFYPYLPEIAAAFFKNGVMLEDIEDKQEKAFYKIADYFSADLEVWWHIRCGSREERFREILQQSVADEKYPRTDGAKIAIAYFLEEVKDEKFFL